MRETTNGRTVMLLRLWCSLALALTLVTAGVGVQLRPAAVSAMQSGTPAADDEPEDDEPADEEETSNEGTSSSTGSMSDEDMALEPGNPAVLAQGATYVPGGNLVWTVTKFDAPDVDDATSESGASALLLQTQGKAIVRNDVTGKRAQLESGEGFFRAPDDAYTISAVGSSSTYWAFELVGEDDADVDAFYEGPLVEDVDEGVYDMEMTRYILQPGESADLPEFNGTGLTMVLSGEIEVRGERVASLGVGDGQTVQGDAGDAVVTNSGAQPAVYLFLSLGDTISDETAGAGTASQQATAAPQETPDTDPGTDTQETPDTDPGATGTASVSVTALADIYVTVTVDGTIAYDGALASGQSTGAIAGTNFEVYTSSGENTQFTNGCGDTFFMGYEGGEATYYLTAEPGC